VPLGAAVQGRVPTPVGPVTVTAVGIPAGWAALGTTVLLGLAAAAGVALVRR
jgi:hypothetical protein